MCTWVLSCVQLFVTPWTITFRAPLSLEYSRQEYWNGLPFPTPGTMKTWTPSHMPIKLLLKVFLLIFLSIYTQCTLIIFILQLITFYKSLNSGFIYKSHTDKSCFTKMHLFKSTLKYILIDKCHQLIYTESESEVAKSCPILWTPWTVAYQAPLSMGFSRQAYWSGLPFPSPGDLPNPGIKPGSPALQADTLPSEPPGKLYLHRNLV